jgi:hypothetical protein
VCRYAAGLAALATLASCAGQGSVEAQPAGDAARRFVTAQVDDVASACALLAPKTLQEVQTEGACPSVLADSAPSAAPRLESVEVYGTNAMARFDGDTVFLARFREGWRVTAARCRPDGAKRPYQCEIQAG